MDPESIIKSLIQSTQDLDARITRMEHIMAPIVEVDKVRSLVAEFNFQAAQYTMHDRLGWKARYLPPTALVQRCKHLSERAALKALDRRLETYDLPPYAEEGGLILEWELASIASDDVRIAQMLKWFASHRRKIFLAVKNKTKTK